jgi:peptidoglycan/LPS O-acetylase OafA/YrhL
MAKGFGRARSSTLWGVLIAAWCIGLALPVLYLSWSGVPPEATRQPGWMFNTLVYHPVPHVPEFAAGAIAAVLYLRRTPDVEAKLARWSVIAVPLAMAALLFGLAKANWFPYVVIHNGLFVPLYLIIIVGLAAGGHGLVARTLSWRPLVLLGDASYAMYIFQIPFWITLEKLTRNGPLSAHPALLCALEFAVFVPLCILPYKYVEEPARIRLKGVIKARLGKRKEPKSIAFVSPQEPV